MYSSAASQRFAIVCMGLLFSLEYIFGIKQTAVNGAATAVQEQQFCCYFINLLVLLQSSISTNPAATFLEAEFHQLAFAVSRCDRNH